MVYHNGALKYPQPFYMKDWTRVSRNQRRKSQRIKIHRLGYRFSLDLYGNYKHLAKVSRLLVCGFFLFKSIGWYGFSYGILVVLNVYQYHQCLFKVITSLKFYKHRDNLQKHFCIIGWCVVRQRNL
jgi:hypothetical protein